MENKANYTEYFISGRKGQISFFVIAGIVILITVAAYFALTSLKEIPFMKPITPELSFKSFTEECVKSTAEDAVRLLGVQGGYIIAPSLSLDTNYSVIAYHYYKGRIVMPYAASIEAELAAYMENALNFCFSNFTEYRKQGFNVTEAPVKANVVIRDKDILIEIDSATKLSKIDSVMEIGRYSASVPVRMKHVLDIARAVNIKTASDPEWVDMTFLSSFDVKIDVIPHDAENFVYSITDSESLVKGEPYVFLFANSFIVNKAPVLNLPLSITLEEGLPAVLRINATDPEGDALTYSDDTAMFDIGQDGVISFLPEIPGEFDVVITVEDTHNNRVSKQIKMIIE
jgi:hypothetical protein